MSDLSTKLRQRMHEEEVQAEQQTEAESRRKRRQVNRASRYGIGATLLLLVGLTPVVLSAIAGEKAEEPTAQETVATVIQDDTAQQSVSTSPVMMSGEDVAVTYGIGDEFNLQKDERCHGGCLLGNGAGLRHQVRI